jgi:hypothetical protein
VLHPSGVLRVGPFWQDNIMGVSYLMIIAINVVAFFSTSSHGNWDDLQLDD